jgi:protein phosphatase
MKQNSEIDIQNRKALVILVGCPGAGKSTWGKKFAAENNLVYVSTDAIRAELGTGEGDQNVSAAAFATARGRISTALGAGKSAMIDATSVTKKARKDWINLGRGHGAYIIAVAFEVPREELLRRDAQRERHVGPDIVDRFLGKYERPTDVEVDKVIIK